MFVLETSSFYPFCSIREDRSFYEAVNIYLDVEERDILKYDLL